MKPPPWQNKSVDPDARQRMLEKAYSDLVENPVWAMMQREALARKNIGLHQLLNPSYTGEQLKYYQGEVSAWDDVPELPRRIFEMEEAEIDRDISIDGA